MPHPFIYADSAATSPLSEAAFNEMLPYLKEEYGNPSGLYKLGRSAGKAVNSARERIAGTVGAQRGEIYFTSGGSESDNWAVTAAAEIGAAKGRRRIITAAVEHPALLNACKHLETKGFAVTYLPPSPDGKITAEQVENALTDDTALVSVMYANNETGVIMPVPEIGRLCRKKGVLFHTDAVQAFGNIPINVKEQNIGLMSVSGHKLGGPKGTGFLYVSEETDLPPLIFGGGQERGKRGGTENTAGIVGLACAAEERCTDIPQKAARLAAMRDKITDSILSSVPYSRLNGSRNDRLAGNINISFLGVESESLLLMLDMKGICASGGSACSSRSSEPSHVLTAMGLPPEIASGALRLTFADPISDSDADYIAAAVAESVEQLRKSSVLWEKVRSDPRLTAYFPGQN